MAKKNDDIKQLFSHLGLNPGDYQEIRNAPSSNATMTGAPRRWALLHAAPAPETARRAGSPPPAMPPEPSASLLARPPPTPLATLTDPEPSTAAADGLASLFQSVRVSLPAAITTPPPPIHDWAASPAAASPVELPQDRLLRELRDGARGLGAVQPPSPWAGYDPDRETRQSPVVLRAAPVPAAPLPAAPMPLMRPPIMTPAPAAAVQAPPPAVVAPAPAPLPHQPSPVVAGAALQAIFRRLSTPDPIPVASGRLRLSYPPPQATTGRPEERLGDVLKRVSAQNGSSKK